MRGMMRLPVAGHLHHEMIMEDVGDVLPLSGFHLPL